MYMCAVTNILKKANCCSILKSIPISAIERMANSVDKMATQWWTPSQNTWRSEVSPGKAGHQPTRPSDLGHEEIRRRKHFPMGLDAYTFREGKPGDSGN